MPKYARIPPPLSKLPSLLMTKILFTLFLMQSYWQIFVPPKNRDLNVLLEMVMDTRLIFVLTISEPRRRPKSPIHRLPNQ